MCFKYLHLKDLAWHINPVYPGKRYYNQALVTVAMDCSKNILLKLIKKYGLSRVFKAYYDSQCDIARGRAQACSTTANLHQKK